MFTIATRTKGHIHAKQYSHPRYTMQDFDNVQEAHAFVRFVCEAEGRQVVFFNDQHGIDDQGNEYMICNDIISYCEECSGILSPDDYRICDSCMMQAKFASSLFGVTYVDDDDEA